MKASKTLALTALAFGVAGVAAYGVRKMMRAAKSTADKVHEPSAEPKYVLIVGHDLTDFQPVETEPRSLSLEEARRKAHDLQKTGGQGLNLRLFNLSTGAIQEVCDCAHD